jgi:cytochrome b561
MLFGDFYPREDEAPEGIEFLAVAALTLWVPTLLYCYLTGQYSPLFLITYHQTLGVLLGVLMFHRLYVVSL